MRSFQKTVENQEDENVFFFFFFFFFCFCFLITGSEFRDCIFFSNPTSLFIFVKTCSDEHFVITREYSLCQRPIRRLGTYDDIFSLKLWHVQ